MNKNVFKLVKNKYINKLFYNKKLMKKYKKKSKKKTNDLQEEIINFQILLLFKAEFLLQNLELYYIQSITFLS